MIEQEHFPELEFSPDVNELFTALAKAQGAIECIDRDREVTVKTNTGQSYQYTYATLGQVREACRKPFAESGLSILQFPSYAPTPPTVTVITLLGHSSGQWAKARLRLPVAKADAQGIGSAITYARRYTWTAIIGLASEEDDDAQAADAIQGSTQPRGNRTGQNAGRDAGSRRQQNVPESRGDQAANRPAQPSQAAATSATTAEPPTSEELRKLQRGWHAELRDHCGDLNTEDRHKFAAALIGKPVKTETEWKVAHYSEAKRLLGLHIAECQGSPCGLLAKTLGLQPTGEVTPATSPPRTDADIREEMEQARQEWLDAVATHASSFDDPADRHAYATLLLGRKILNDDGWTVAHYQSATRKLQEHAKGCTAELCPWVSQVMGLSPQPSETTGEAEAPPTDTPDANTLACSRVDCGKPLTRGQHEVSVRAFGQPLCPACQRTQARAAA